MLGLGRVLLAVLLWGLGWGAQAAAPARLVVLDWASAETLVALGVPPVGMAHVPDYRIWSGDMPLPPEVADVGLRMEPNLERIQALRPDGIVISPMQEGLRPLLTRIAPVHTITFNSAQQPDGYRQAEQATRDLGQLVGRATQADQLIATTRAAVQQLLAPLQAQGSLRPLYLLRFADRHHAWVLDGHSLFGGALQAGGARLAWQGQSNLWGFATLPLTSLRQVPQALIIAIAPWPFRSLAELDHSPLWQQLPAVRAGRLLTLPPVWLGNGLPSVQRFCHLLAAAWTPGQVVLPQTDVAGGQTE